MTPVAMLLGGSERPAQPVAAPRTITQQSHAWEQSLQRLGFRIVRPVTPPGPPPGTPPATFADVALVVVEHSARRPDQMLEAMLDKELQEYAASGGACIVHHHDLASIPTPDPLSGDRPVRDMSINLHGARVRHVAVNLRARRELHARGVTASSLVPYAFDFAQPAGDRAAIRTELGIADDTILCLQATRVAADKNVAGSILALQHLARIIPASRLHFWLSGPIEPNFQPMFERLIAQCPVSHTERPFTMSADAYAACDVVLYPATFDRGGTAIFEAIAARRPCLVGSFPTRGELEACGLRFFSFDAPNEIVKFLAKPSEQLHDVNLRRAKLSFGTDLLDESLRALCDEIGVVR